MTVKKSRLTLARAAIRPAMHGKMLLGGPSGAGKTYTALTIAEVLAGPDGRVLVIDTEKESALTYADLFKFEHLRWQSPFDPRELADTLLEAGGQYDIVIVDSFTHFWRGSGGTLDIANGKFTGWKDARPAQVDVTEAMLEADCHVIACVRSKMEHAQQTGANGKIEVVKLGMAPEQDDDFEYEVNVSIEIDMQHAMQVGKSRTNAVPVGRTFTAGHAEDFATIYKEWLAGGEPVADRNAVNAIVATLDGIADRGERLKAKEMFLECFGRPEFLLQSRLPEAQNWARERVTELAAPAQQIDGSGAPALGGPAPADPEDPEPSDSSTAGEPSGEAGDSTDPPGEGSEPDETSSNGHGAAASPAAKQACVLCGSTRSGLDPGPDGPVCTVRAACAARQEANHAYARSTA